MEPAGRTPDRCGEASECPDEREPETLDAQRILEELARHRVEFVLVGGMAAQTHGNTRMTDDVDVIPQPDPQNLGRLAEALRAWRHGSSTRDRRTSKSTPRCCRGHDRALAAPHGDIDVLHEAPGAAPYDELRERALVIALDESASRSPAATT